MAKDGIYRTGRIVPKTETFIIEKTDGKMSFEIHGVTDENIAPEDLVAVILNNAQRIIDGKEPEERTGGVEGQEVIDFIERLGIADTEEGQKIINIIKGGNIPIIEGGNSPISQGETGKIGDGFIIDDKDTDIEETAELPTNEEDIDKTGEEKPKKEDEEKRKLISPIALGKATKIGASIIAALALAALIRGTTISRDTIEITKSDYNMGQTVNDTSITRAGENGNYAYSVVKNPGKLLHDLRDAVAGENNITQSRLKDYLEKNSYVERVEEENYIIEITKAYDALQETIEENMNILKDSNGLTEEQKKEIFSKILEAKAAQQQIYIENKELYEEYTNIAKAVYAKDGGDSRTSDEQYMAEAGLEEYKIGEENLGRDVECLKAVLYILEHQEELFKEPSEAGTIENSTGTKKEYKSVDYQSGIGIHGAHSVGANNFTIGSEEIANVITTHRGLVAIKNIIKNVVEKLKEKTHQIGKISIFGHKVYDDQEEKNGPEL